MQCPSRKILPRAVGLAAAVWLGACAPAASESQVRAPASGPTEVSASPSGTDRIGADLSYLAGDALEGRAPGTKGDEAARRYIAEAMRGIGLLPAFASGYEQTFEVTEGVAPRPGAHVWLTVNGDALPVGPLAVSSAGAVEDAAPVVFVGPGVAPKGRGSGDYAGVGRAVEGAVAVAVARDPEDPHVDPAALRIGARTLAAKEHGAVAFVWWDPEADADAVAALALGRADDLGIPAVVCGAACNEALERAFRMKAPGAWPKPGTRSRSWATLSVPIERVRVETANVAGILPAGAEDDGDRGIVVVGAHHDHLGRGRPGSLAPEAREIHNGADDNASGVAAILELARRLAARPARERRFDVIVVAFGAEEMGLIGSKRFVESLDDATRKRIVAMLNFDMVGRYRPDTGLVVSGVGTADRWNEILDAVSTSLVLRRKQDGYGPSDHSSFYEAQIPVLHFFTGNHPDYHRPTDDVDRVDVEGIEAIVALAEGVVAGLEEGPRLAYRRMERPKRAVRGFRVSLGTIPDYAAEVKGVRLSGVRPGGAADRAGLRAGDVVVELAGRPVENIEAYMAAFALLEPGKPARVVVLRDGARTVLEIVPDAPRRKAR
ncbi:MAG: M20/M25/M40 family metallo-hydrolase [Deltaproteobacteria bacterium]|nr:MAG: M20/M25/M40 family metallo-hydrolase [Deltaproteobacteria bacterium]